MTSKISISVGRVRRNVRRLRIERGLSQHELSTEADITRAYLGRVEARGQNITLMTLDALAAALDVDPQELLADPDIVISSSERGADEVNRDQSEEATENDNTSRTLALKPLSGKRCGQDPSNVNWDRGQRAVVSVIRSWSASHVSKMSLRAIVSLDMELTNYGSGPDVSGSRFKRWRTLLEGEVDRVNVCDARVQKYRDHGMHAEAERLQRAWNEALQKKSYGERLLIAREIYWTASVEQEDETVYQTLTTVSGGENHPFNLIFRPKADQEDKVEEE